MTPGVRPMTLTQALIVLGVCALAAVICAFAAVGVVEIVCG